MNQPTTTAYAALIVTICGSTTPAALASSPSPWSDLDRLRIDWIASASWESRLFSPGTHWAIPGTTRAAETSPQGPTFIRWIGTTQGSFQDATLWDSGTVPGADDRPMFDRQDPSSIFLESDTTIQSLTAELGTTTLDLGGMTLTLDQTGFDTPALTVSGQALAAEQANLVIENGTLQSDAETYIGLGPNQYGKLTLTNNATWNAASNLYIGKGSGSATGELEVLNNSTLHGQWILIGDDNADGLATINNAELIAEQFLTVGRNGGTGILNLNNNAVVRSDQYMVIGRFGGYGEVNLDNSDLFATGGLSIGLDGGAGTLTATNSSTIQSDYFFIGDTDTGLATLTDTTANASLELIVGLRDGSSGTLNLTDSSIIAERSWVGHDEGSHGEIHLNNSSWSGGSELQITRYGSAQVTATNDSTINAGSLWIGNFGGSDGSLMMHDSQLNADYMYMGTFEGSNGTLELNASNARFGRYAPIISRGTVFVGEYGDASLTLNDSSLTALILFCAARPTSSSSIELNQSSVTLYQALLLSGFSDVSGGAAAMTMDQSNMNADEAYLWTGATLDATDSNISFDETYLRGADLRFDGGDYNLGVLLEDDGSIELHSGSLTFTGSSFNLIDWHGGSINAPDSAFDFGASPGFTASSAIGRGPHGDLILGGPIFGIGELQVDSGYLEAETQIGGSLVIMNGGHANLRRYAEYDLNAVDLQDGTFEIETIGNDPLLIDTTGLSDPVFTDFAVLESGENLIVHGSISVFGGFGDDTTPMILDGGSLTVSGFTDISPFNEGAEFEFRSGHLNIGTTSIGDSIGGRWHPDELVLDDNTILTVTNLFINNGSLIVENDDSLTYNTLRLNSGTLTISEFNEDWSTDWIAGTLHETRFDGTDTIGADLQHLTAGKSWTTDRHVFIGGTHNSNDTVGADALTFNNGLTIDGSAGSSDHQITFNAGSVKAYGVTNISNYDVLFDSTTTTSRLSGLINISDPATPGATNVTLQNSMHMSLSSGSELNVYDQGTLNIGNGWLLLSDADVNIDGGTANVLPNNPNNRTRVTGNASINVTNAGTLNIGAQGQSSTIDVNISIDRLFASGEGSSINVYQPSSDLIFAEEIVLRDGAVLRDAHAQLGAWRYDIRDSTVVTPTLWLSSPFESSRLAGNSTIEGDLRVDEGSVVGQSDIRDNIHVTGNYRQYAFSTLNIEFFSASNHDMLTVDGQATLEGTLRIYINHAIPLFEDGFTFLSADSIVGEFDSVQFIGTPNIYTIDYSINGLTLRAVPTPSGVLLLGLASLGLGAQRRRTAA